jgi:ribosomal protein S18 acetylase RimI-like enzyme
MIRLIEELSFNAWPALRTVHYDGWVLRFADGFSKRANSINPLYDSTIDTAHKIERCEALYGAMDLKTIFKLNEVSHPQGLDATLAARGYEVVDPVSVQVLELNAGGDAPSGDIEISADPTGAWLDAYCAMDARAAGARATLERMLGLIVPRTAYASLKEEGVVIACAMGTLDSGFLGLFNIIVDKAHRNKGCARRIMSGLLGWARNEGADAAYLQVLKNNSTAIGLYRNFGFREISKYWYRIGN